jgi:hypothetical protein
LSGIDSVNIQRNDNVNSNLPQKKMKFYHIFQAISMAVQRGNVQCVQGAYGESAFEELDEIFYILQPNCIF